VRFWQRSHENYRAGDRVFAILERPEVALLLTCEAPGSWTATVFDFARKQAVAAANHHSSISKAQEYLVAELEKLYHVVAPVGEIRWQQALNRPDILQT
jgi:hypothetical protein